LSRKGLQLKDAESIATRIGFPSGSIPEAAQTMMTLYDMFIKYDATMVEINPLGQDTDGNVICMDAKFNFDDNASFRQKEIFELRDPSQVSCRG
jgi:succinyl-CoA synthetase beta subunit